MTTRRCEPPCRGTGIGGGHPTLRMRFAAARVGGPRIPGAGQARGTGASRSRHPAAARYAEAPPAWPSWRDGTVARPTPASPRAFARHLDRTMNSPRAVAAEAQGRQLKLAVKWHESYGGGAGGTAPALRTATRARPAAPDRLARFRPRRPALIIAASTLRGDRSWRRRC